jgi:hypothetical protein
LELPRLDVDLGSMGEMGFTSNLDTLLGGGIFEDIEVTVAATFGWPTVPDDVQRATIWTAYEIETSGPSSGGDLAGKSVAEVSESYFASQLAGQGNVSPDPLPPRARAIIDNYQRVRV